MRKVIFATGLLLLSLLVAAPCGVASAAPRKSRSSDPELAYLRALAGLRNGKKTEFISGRNTLRVIATSRENSKLRTDPIRASTLQSVHSDLLMFELRHIKIGLLSFGMLRASPKQRASNYLTGLPPTYVPGFAFMGDSGTAAVDPDPFIRLELIRDRYSFRAGDSGF